MSEHDFVVVDTLLKPPALEQISNYLLRSTIWFDVTNGAALVAHLDDGLVLQSVLDIGKHLAAAVTTSSEDIAANVYRVSNVYATLMNVSDSRLGPVAAGS
jgi:hypothetical protein